MLLPRLQPPASAFFHFHPSSCDHLFRTSHYCHLLTFTLTLVPAAMGCCRCRRPEAGSLTSIRPYKDRSCTDVFFLLLFVGCWAAMGYACYLAIHNGNPDRLSLTHGVDMYGQTCGVSAAVKDKPYAAWPFPTQYAYMICVANCSATLNDSNIALHVPSVAELYYCIPDPSALYNLSAQLNLTSYAPDSQYLQSATNDALSAAGDIIATYPVILGSAGITLALSFVWLIVLQFFAGVMVYALLAAVCLGGALSGYALLNYANHTASADPTITTNQLNMMRYTAYVVLSLTAVFVLVLLAIRKRIRLAIQVIKEASRALSAVRSLVLLPLLPLVLFVGFAAGWAVMALYMYSVGGYAEVATPNQVLYDFYTAQRNDNPALSAQFVWDANYKYLFGLHFFMFLWTTEFLVYLTFMVLAGTVADWYFTPKSGAQAAQIADMEAASAMAHDAATHAHVVQVRSPGAVTKPASQHRMSRFPVLASLGRTVRFHLGTVLAAALIIAVIQMVRAVVAYVQAKTRNQQSRVAKAIFACVQCCLKCVQTIIDKVNCNALIWSAIYGDNFVDSVSGSFQLIWNNLFRVAAINLVGNFLFLLGKLVIAAGSTGIALLILSNAPAYKDNEHIRSLFAPCLLIFVLSYVVATLFMTVFSTTVDTVFLCFLVDCQENERDGVMLASAGLRELIQSHAQQSELEAKHRIERSMYEAAAAGGGSAQVQVAPAPGVNVKK